MICFRAGTLCAGATPVPIICQVCRGSATEGIAEGKVEKMGDPKRGLYKKFIVHRRDGASMPGKKHDGCGYFVLDLTHDRHAADALEAYAHSCRQEYPLLAKDLLAMVVDMDQRFGGRRRT